MDNDEFFPSQMFTDVNSIEPFTFTIANRTMKLNCLSRDFQHTLKAEGKVVWPASELLCHYIHNITSTKPDNNVFLDKNILEVGSGQGLPGMFVTPFAKSITLTDYDTDALELLSNNINLNFNGSQKSPLVTKLIWGDQKSMQDLQTVTQVNQYDTIIGADIVYYKAAVRPLFQTAHTLLKEDGVFILCNQDIRLSINTKEFYAAIEEFQFEKEEISLESFMTKVPVDKTWLFIFRKKKKS